MSINFKANRFNKDIIKTDIKYSQSKLKGKLIKIVKKLQTWNKQTNFNNIDKTKKIIIGEA